VSHKSEDKKTIAPIVVALRNRGFRVWLDSLEIDERQAQAGLFRRPISVGIQRSSFVLLFTSREYCESAYCREEAIFFIERFSKQPHRIIEVSLKQNEARELLGIPPTSTRIEFEGSETTWEKQERYEALVDEIIFRSRKAMQHSK
jgi:hypothetical protein